MRSRSRASISAFWCALARLVKGKAARLRARRMRLEMTMSDSGPLPRNHSPLVWVRLSRFILGFPLSEQVAQAGGLLVGLFLDRPPQPPLQLDDLGLEAGGAGPVPRG